MVNSRFYQKEENLAGQRVMITGCTSGIGKACAFRFAELGCQLILIGRDEGRLQKLAHEIQQALQQIASQPASSGFPTPPSYPPPELIKLDLRDIRMISELPAKVQRVDILINNAGMNLGSNAVDGVQLDNAVSMVSCNFMAPMELVSAFGREMKKRGSGHIINLCSTAAQDVYQNASVYCATKAALAAYTQAVRHDFLETPIRVTAINPGLVDTELHVKKLGDPGKAKAVCEGVIPLDPNDIADQIIYACTRPAHVQVAALSSYCTNQSHSGTSGVPPISRVGPSFGAPVSPYNSQPVPEAPQQPWSHAAPLPPPSAPPPPPQWGQQPLHYQAPQQNGVYSQPWSNSSPRTGSRSGSQPPSPRGPQQPQQPWGQDMSQQQTYQPQADVLPIRDFGHKSPVPPSPSFGHAHMPQQATHMPQQAPFRNGM